jgi:Guanosine polyphosphate pyrophosphohydrolases/synthetases
MVRFNDIIEEITKYNPEADLELLRKAYIFSAQAHKGQIRLSGEPYLLHPLEVAYILTKMNLDVPSIVSGLLHDTIEDSYVSKEEIERYFGKEVAEIVDGVTKISKIQLRSRSDSKAENIRKMILAMSKGLRVILIKLADRYHNMQTLHFLSEEKQLEIAKETLEIYAPLAHRLGIEWIKGELEDIAFKYLKPVEYNIIVQKLAKKRKEREQYIQELIDVIKKRLKENGINAEVSGRQREYIASTEK